MEEMIFSWVEFLSIQKGQRPNTVMRYEKVVRSFLSWAKVPPAEVTPHHIAEWMKVLFYDQGNVSNRSRATKLSALRSFFSWARHSRHIQSDPTKGIPSPKIQPHLPQKFSTEELRLLFSAPDLDTLQGLRDLAILKTLYAAGPRVSELVGLDLSDVIDSGGYIRLKLSGKGGKERSVTMRRNPAKALREWVAFRRGMQIESPAVFVSLNQWSTQQNASRLSDRSALNVIKKYARLVGIIEEEVFCHKMRATFITDLYDSGHDKCHRCGAGVRNYDIFEIMLLAGHDDPKTTMGYTAISERRLQKIAIPDSRFNEIENGE